MKPMDLNKLPISLRNKIVLLSCVMVFITASLMGGFSFLRTMQITLNTAIEGLASETRLMALRFSNIYHDIENDAFVVARTPPIKGMIRSLKNNGIDPLDNSTDKLWRNRLQTIFSSIMESREHYTQMRYIGIAQDGRELVRVNRTDSGLVPVPYGKLQSKGSENYFKKSLQLRKNETLFSDISYNREFGKLDSNLLPTLRAIVPIFDNNNLFGIIVINANYPKLLEKTFREISPKKNTFIINHTGDYMEYKKNGAISKFQLHGHYESPPPEFIKKINQFNTHEKSFAEGEQLIYFVKLKIDPKNPKNFLGLALRADKNELLAEAYTVQRDTFILIVIIISVCLLVTIFASTQLTFPLKTMTAEISKINTYQQLPNLPTDQNDEIGDFSRAFLNMTRHLQRSEAKSKIVLDNIIDAIITFDDQGVIDNINLACEEIFGYQNQEASGLNIRQLIPDYSILNPKPSLKKHAQVEHNTIIGTTGEAQGKRKNGELFPIDLAISQTKIDQGKLFTGVIRDITERKQMETIKDEFVSTVNHELRTPITSIKGSLGLLKATVYDSLDQKGQRLLSICYDNCEQLAHLVNDILDMEKISAGKMEYNLQNTDMCALTDEIIKRHQSYADKYNVTFRFKTDLKNVYCLVDPSRFNQALVNLISNAAKFSPAGEVVTISIAMHSQKTLRISVADNGSGIPHAFRSKIFDKFAQADSSSTRIEGGSGLGLNITRSIIEAFSGTVTFESEEGQGTTFHFTLPVCEAGAK